MTNDDVKEYLVNMAQHPERRKVGVEADMFSRVDALTLRQKAIEEQMAEHKQAALKLVEEDKNIMGNIDLLVSVLIEAEEKRRAENGE